MKQFTIYHTNDIHSCFDEFAKIQTYLRTHASVNDWILDGGDFADAKHIAVSGTKGSGATALFPRATSQADMLACTFGDCREGQIPRCLHRFWLDARMLTSGSLTGHCPLRCAGNRK